MRSPSSRSASSGSSAARLSSADAVCASERISTHDELLERLDALLPALVDRTEPLLLEVVVAQDATFDP